MEPGGGGWSQGGGMVLVSIHDTCDKKEACSCVAKVIRKKLPKSYD